MPERVSDPSLCDDDRGHCFLEPGTVGTHCECGKMDVRPGPSYGWIGFPELPAVPLWYLQAQQQGLTGRA
jgi:hypothetical protein